MTITPADAITIFLKVAAATEGACEVGANAGPYVERVLKRTGNRKGDPWCAAQVTDWGVIALGEQWPVKRSASVQQIAEWAQAKGVRYAVTMARPGDLFIIWFASLRRFAHIGVVTGVKDGKVETIEGNTNAAGGREGWLVARKTRTLSSADRILRWTEAFV